MAKKSAIEKNKRRMQLAAQYGAKRTRLKKAAADESALTMVSQPADSPVGQ